MFIIYIQNNKQIPHDIQNIKSFVFVSKHIHKMFKYFKHGKLSCSESLDIHSHRFIFRSNIINNILLLYYTKVLTNTVIH